MRICMPIWASRRQSRSELATEAPALQMCQPSLSRPLIIRAWWMHHFSKRMSFWVTSASRTLLHPRPRTTSPPRCLTTFHPRRASKDARLWKRICGRWDARFSRFAQVVRYLSRSLVPAWTYLSRQLGCWDVCPTRSGTLLRSVGDGSKKTGSRRARRLKNVLAYCSRRTRSLSVMSCVR